MKDKTRSRRRRTPVEQEPDLLAKLKRVYGSQTVDVDLFGRRQALSSEIERLLEHYADSMKVTKPR